MLARGGHITPLAQDTLRERRVTVVREGRASPDDAALAPPADIRTVAIASDHTGVTLRRDARRRSCAAAGWRLTISGPTDPIRWTILTWRRRSRELVARGDADGGIVIDGAGIGSAIAANKVRGIRAVMAPIADDRALRARAQRRQRADARRDAGQRRTRRGRS